MPAANSTNTKTQTNAAKKAAKPFEDLETALDVLDGAGICDFLEGATDDLKTATQVETIEDFKANLDEAAGRLRRAIACIERLSARCPA